MYRSPSKSGMNNRNIQSNNLRKHIQDRNKTADNTYIDGQVLITLTGDVDGNFRVDMVDVGLVCDAFGSEPGAPNWNKNADLDGNNRADMIDIGIVCDNFGKEYP